jgi:hypothetical protein
MCDLTSLQTFGTMMGAQSQASALKSQAGAVQEQGYENESDYRNKARVDLADQLAALSTRGTSVSTGTPLALLQQSARNQELDALRLRADGINKANSLRYQASAVLRAAPYTAATQVLTNATKIAELAAGG